VSRVAKQAVIIPAKVTLTQTDQTVNIKGSKGQLSHVVHALVKLENSKDEDGNALLKFAPVEDSIKAWAIAGTTRNVINNMVLGVSNGFSKTLLIEGVGYRAQLKGNTLHLTLGYSHPVVYALPDGISIQAPSQTELVISGIDKQLVGQTAAEIRAFRKPDAYKNKGVRYKGEVLVRKEAKSKK
jgi:large subunit ribosomal protein L6